GAGARSPGREIRERDQACLVRLGRRRGEERGRVAAPGGPSLGGAVTASGGRPAGRGAAASGPSGDTVEVDLRHAQERATPLDTLQALRRLAARGLGAAEAKAIRSVADDQGMHDLVRAWAWRALARTDPPTVLERAAALGDEPSPYPRRAVAVAGALAGGRSARTFLRHHRRTADGAATADWGLAR